jgi:5,10-methylenetetrahydrofolate reductase
MDESNGVSSTPAPRYSGKPPFLLLAELVPAQADDLRPIEGFLLDYASRKSEIPAGMRLAGITLPQNPRGNAILDPADVYAVIAAKNPPGFAEAALTANPSAEMSRSGPHAHNRGLWADLDVVPHLTAKEQNADALRSSLLGLRALGLNSVLAVTGDKPASGKRVFELDSIGLLELLNDLNFDVFQKTPLSRLTGAASLPPAAPSSLRELLSGASASSRPVSGFSAVPQFFALAAVSPFKYTEASLRQQYFKLGKKIRAGASALITQMGWDSRKSEELFRFLREARIDIPVFGNVYFLSNVGPAARLMHDGQIPGCYVSDELFAAVQGGKSADFIDRAACQIAMYRDLGAAGADLGGVPDFETVLKILAQAERIGAAWRDRRALLDFPPKRLASGAAPFYLYAETAVDSSRSAGVPPNRLRRRSFHQRHFDFLHRNFLTKGSRLCPAATAAFRLSKSLKRGEGVLYKLFHGVEKTAKTVFFNCEDCGDCFLTENFSYCTLGDCEKGLPNPPCGDATPEGYCGNNTDRICVAESIYAAAAASGPSRGAGARAGGALADLAAASNPPRIAGLENSSAVLNYLFDRDHTARTPLIQIGELLHASIPKTAAAMREILALGLIETGSAALPSPKSPPLGSRPAALEYLVSLIKTQVKHGASYLDVNVDAFGDDDLGYRKAMMRFFVRLIRDYSAGIPVCVDSGSPDVIEAGLIAWYEGGNASFETLPRPLLNSVKTYTMERLLPLRARYPFKFIGLLVDEKSAGHDGAYGVDELLVLARELFREATGRYGFAPSDMFIDSTVFPLSIDVPMDAEKPGFTYRAFETIRRIKSDPAFRGVHLSLGVTNSVRDLPGRRTGVCRAYLATAMARGLDAAIVNVLHEYGKRPPAPDLLDFVDAFVRQDGTPAAVQRALDMMMNFCRANRTRPSR